MKDNERQIRARKNWLKVYQDVGSVSKAALRCGVARSTMYRWIKRYSEAGESGLSDKSKRPKNLTNTKVSKEIESLILELRRKKKWGAQRISIHLLSEVIDTFEFPIQRIQTDWGTEFFNYDFQYELHEHFIKFRPIKPKTPHLNGKVERTQQTDKVEFWSLFDLSDDSLKLEYLAIEWQEFYNKKRPHSSLNGKTPWQKLKSVEHLIPIQPDVTKQFWDSKEEVWPRNYEYLKRFKNTNK